MASKVSFIRSKMRSELTSRTRVVRAGEDADEQSLAHTELYPLVGRAELPLQQIDGGLELRLGKPAEQLGDHAHGGKATAGRFQSGEGAREVLEAHRARLVSR
jgi:hypothetical protein